MFLLCLWHVPAHLGGLTRPGPLLLRREQSPLRALRAGSVLASAALGFGCPRWGGCAAGSRAASLRGERPAAGAARAVPVASARCSAPAPMAAATAAPVRQTPGNLPASPPRWWPWQAGEAPWQSPGIPTDALFSRHLGKCIAPQQAFGRTAPPKRNPGTTLPTSRRRSALKPSRQPVPVPGLCVGREGHGHILQWKMWKT